MEGPAGTCSADDGDGIRSDGGFPAAVVQDGARGGSSAATGSGGEGRSKGSLDSDGLT